MLTSSSLQDQVSPTSPPLASVTPPTTCPPLPVFSAPSLLVPPVSSPQFVPLTRPSPPAFMPAPPPPPLVPSFLNETLSKSYQMHLNFLNEARRNQGLLMPTPKYPHEVSPSTSPPVPSPPEVPVVAPPSMALKAAGENVSEMAARLLFMNVKWAHHVPAFTSLPYR